MRHRRMSVIYIGTLAVLALLLPSMTQAAGTEPTLTVKVPAEASLGESVNIEATLLAPDGSPIAGVPIQFFSPTSFTSLTSRMLLGEASTDYAGVAVLEYELRRNEDVKFIAGFTGNFQYEAAEASTTVAVQGSAQLYQEVAGIRVPGLNVSLLVVVLGLVWSVYFMVFTLVLRIARAGAHLEGVRE